MFSTSNSSTMTQVGDDYLNKKYIAVAHYSNN